VAGIRRGNRLIGWLEMQATLALKQTSTLGGESEPIGCYIMSNEGGGGSIVCWNRRFGFTGFHAGGGLHSMELTFRRGNGARLTLVGASNWPATNIFGRLLPRFLARFTLSTDTRAFIGVGYGKQKIHGVGHLVEKINWVSEQVRDLTGFAPWGGKESGVVGNKNVNAF